MKEKFNNHPHTIIEGENKKVFCFHSENGLSNLDQKVVVDFGEEWEKFHDFSDEVIDHNGKMYFDILTEEMVNKNTYGIDIGCGTGRWTKYLAPRIGFMEAIDPSNAIFTADKLLKDTTNVRLSQASVDTIPFDDETFDFAMSVGVLHHIPDTKKALSDCVKKIKKGGYFYTYLYYNFENKGFLFKTVFFMVNLLRKIISKFPPFLKKLSCDIIAILVYMPVILAGRIIKAMGMKSPGNKMPLSFYHDQTFTVIRNDALDRFGTRLEQRFSRKQIVGMMQEAGLEDIEISNGMPYWHAVGRKKYA